MSDATDAVAQAVARNRQLAASCLVRKEEAEAELARRRTERESEGADTVALDARIAAATADLADADAQLQAAQAELKQLRSLAGSARAPRIPVVESDPLIQTLEEQALDRVRGHIAETDAKARLGDELAGPNPSATAAPVAPVARPAKPTAAEADADALRKFQEMRAKLVKPSPSAAAPDAGPATPAASPPPKKTM